MINENVFQLKKNGEPRKGLCFCKNPELIENYEAAIADTTKTWICHHKLEAWFSHQELKDMGKYFDRPARELVFCETEIEHQKWPHKGHIEGAKKRIGRKRSEETKAKMSASHKGNNAVRGKHWYSNGTTCVMAFECPEGFVKGRLHNNKK